MWGPQGSSFPMQAYERHLRPGNLAPPHIQSQRGVEPRLACEVLMPSRFWRSIWCKKYCKRIWNLKKSRKSLDWKSWSSCSPVLEGLISQRVQGALRAHAALHSEGTELTCIIEAMSKPGLSFLSRSHRKKIRRELKFFSCSFRFFRYISFLHISVYF